MQFSFIWNGQDLDENSKQTTENIIQSDLKKGFEDILSFTTTVHLFADALTSVISGVAVNSDGKQIIRITKINDPKNTITYEQILDKNNLS